MHNVQSQTDQEFVDLATEKMAAINAAYDRIEKERGLK